jgi:D-aminopeptidase
MNAFSSRPRWIVLSLALVGVAGIYATLSAQQSVAQRVAAPPRVRARDLGIKPGNFATGKWNAITDVEGVRVGHATLVDGDNIRTGVTAILPPVTNPFLNKLPAALYVGNGFGKLVGATQVEELGVIETPILLTNTLSVWQVADVVIDFMLSLPGNQDVKSINPVVGETNDGYLNDIRGRHVGRKLVLAALDGAKFGEVEEGSVGAGTGTVAFNWKGGIGTSSRQLPPEKGGYTVGVLVQTNFGGRLTIDGVPVWKELQPPVPSDRLGKPPGETKVPARGEGSCMIVIATDAPADARQMKRIAKRALFGMARTGSTFSDGSGDYAIAFSTAPEFQSPTGKASISARVTLHDEDLSTLFEAVADATEEAIYNSLLKATTVRGYNGHTAEAIPLDALNRVLNKYGRGSERPLSK